MDWYERLVDFAKQNLRVILWLFLLSGFMLFLPKKWLAVVYLDKVLNSFGPIIGIAFVSSGLLLVIDVSLWGRRRWQAHTNRKQKLELMGRLEELYELPGVRKGFESQQECIYWANRVAPLLKFSQQYYVNFTASSHKLNAIGISGDLAGSLFSVMRSQLEMAIEELRKDLGTKDLRTTGGTT